ncbi:MAG: hypothetical protein V5A55_04730 [Halovenus sp.]
MTPRLNRRTFVTLAAVASVGRADASTGETVAPDAPVAPENAGYGAGGYGAGPYGDPTEGPRLADYANDEGVVDTPGLREAIDDWRTGDIDTDLLRDVIDAWRTGDPV